MISIIVAIAENRAIGKNNELLWHLPNDLKRFKQLTTGKTIVMGRNTWLSLPVRPLPNRRNIVISDIPDEKFEGAETINSIEQAIRMTETEAETFVIGGSMIYRQFLPFAGKIYQTVVHAEFDADTFFPELPSDEWILTEQTGFQADEKHAFDYSYLIYERKR